METTEAKKEMSHSEEQAWAQLSSICEMVGNLTIEGAAKNYADGLDREGLKKILIENEVIEDNPSEDGYGEEVTDEDLREKLVEAITARNADPEAFGLEWDEDAARQTIQEDALSVEVRTDWHSVGDSEQSKPSEFKILLCTGGPAVQIIGELNEHLEPDRARIQHQDWGTPWTDIFGLDASQVEALLTYCQQFYFGE
jgi:hypothetical protein